MWAAQQLSASQGEAGEPVLGQGHIKEAGAEGESMAKAAPRSWTMPRDIRQPPQDTDTRVSVHLLRIKCREYYASLEYTVNKTKEEKWG